MRPRRSLSKPKQRKRLAPFWWPPTLSPTWSPTFPPPPGPRTPSPPTPWGRCWRRQSSWTASRSCAIGSRAAAPSSTGPSGRETSCSASPRKTAPTPMATVWRTSPPCWARAALSLRPPGAPPTPPGTTTCSMRRAFPGCWPTAPSPPTPPTWTGTASPTRCGSTMAAVRPTATWCGRTPSTRWTCWIVSKRPCRTGVGPMTGSPPPFPPRDFSMMCRGPVSPSWERRRASPASGISGFTPAEWR